MLDYNDYIGTCKLGQAHMASHFNGPRAVEPFLFMF